ncbi:MAG: type VI secretion system protein TssL [Oleiphilus sp.]|nr:MAG: type VI secretion system protein TssL [Oleiphilus sp.]
MTAIPAPKKKPKASAGWIVTFADLMSLLLTFFILLLSFSKMDLHKYELMAKSLASAFGVSFIQGQGNVGGEVIFADQPPQSDPLDNQEILEQEFEEAFEEPEEVEMLDDAPQPQEAKQLDPNIERLTESLVDQLEEEILSNALSVTYDADKVVVRFSEATTFPSGSEELKDEMFPILEKIEQVLAACDGDIIVSGYTDDLPVNSSRFRSNWDLSAARAVSVVHQLIFNNKLDVNRVSAAGRAETNPLAPNDTPENRAKNRRVEISVFDPLCESQDFVF